MKKNFLYLLWMAIAASVVFAACSDDDDKDGDMIPEVAPKTEYDELDYLQNSLVELDSAGNFSQRALGALLEADTTIISVGVEDMEEAREIFDGLFAPTTQLATDGNTYTLAGNAGYVTLKEHAEPEDGVLAYVSFDKVPGLKYVTRLNFIQSEAWPDNAPSKSQYKMGFQYELRGFTDEDWLETYVCIREYKQGKQGMLAGISSKSYSLMWRYEGSYGGRMPSAASAEEISSILRKDWDTYKGYFNANGKNLLNDTWHYWIREGYDAGFWQIREAIVLKTGKVDKYDVHWKEPRHNVLFVEYFGGIY